MDLPVQRQIKHAELWAVLQALRHAMPPTKIVTDHEAIVRGIAHGKS